MMLDVNTSIDAICLGHKRLHLKNLFEIVLSTNGHSPNKRLKLHVTEHETHMLVQQCRIPTLLIPSGGV